MMKKENYLHAGYEWRETGGQARLFHYLENGVIVLKGVDELFQYGFNGMSSQPGTLEYNAYLHVFKLMYNK